MIEFDAHEVAELATDLGKVGRKSLPAVLKAGNRSAMGLRDEMRHEASGIGHAPAFPSSITWDRNPLAGFGAAEWEVGPDKDRRQGALGNILYFGTANNGPVVDVNAPARRQEADIAERFADAAMDALEDVL